MSIIVDINRGRVLAKLLYESFMTEGIHGKNDMPEDVLPENLKRGSLDHILFLTLTVSIDYQRDANVLWESARSTWNDPATRYLFNPKLLHETPPRMINKDMQKYKLSKKPRKDAHIWRTVGVTFYKKWKGEPRNFLSDCQWDSLTILNRLKDDQHLYNGKAVSDYPYLRGPKIGPLWLRMLRDNAEIKELKDVDKIPIPVDIHIARATLATGIVRGHVETKLDDVFEHIRNAWFESVKGLKIEKRPMIALDVDEPLWHLSKYGCTNRNKDTGFCPLLPKCEAKDFCIKGAVNIHKNKVLLNTQIDLQS